MAERKNSKKQHFIDENQQPSNQVFSGATQPHGRSPLDARQQSKHLERSADCLDKITGNIDIQSSRCLYLLPVQRLLSHSVFSIVCIDVNNASGTCISAHLWPPITASYPLQKDHLPEELDPSMSEPAKLKDPIAIPEAEPTLTPELVDSDGTSNASQESIPTPNEPIPTPKLLDVDVPPAIPPVVLSPMDETPERGGDGGTGKLTNVGAGASDRETISIHSQQQIIQASGSAHTASLKTTPEKKNDAQDQQQPREPIVTSNQTMARPPGPDLQMPTVAIPANSTVPNQQPSSSASSASDAEACNHHQYGQILHDTLALLIDKHDTVAKMQKDVEVVQAKFAGAYERVMQAHNAMEEAQKRVVAAQEDLVEGLRGQLAVLRALQGEDGCRSESGCCSVAWIAR